MRRPIQMTFVGLFALVILLPIGALVAGFRSSEVENRAVADIPEVSAPKLVDEVFYADMTRAYTDRVPFRDDAITVDAWIDLEVFGDSPSPKVGIGEGDWLFHTESWQAMCRQADVVGAAATMRALTDALAEAGKRTAFVVAPDKAAVYPDMLGQLEASDDCAVARRAELRAALTADPPAGFIDAWDVTSDLRRTSDELIYFPHDTHWTTFTAMAISERIVEELQPGVWDASGVRPVETVPRNGDLANLMGLPRIEEVSHYAFNRTNVTVDRQQFGQRMITKYAAETEDDALIPGRALVIHDSFGNPLQRPLASHFEETWFVHWRLLHLGIVSMDQLVEIVAESEYVVVEVVERLSYGRFISDFPELPEVLAAGLQTAGK